MKRINIYITEDTDKQIDSLSEIFQVNRSEIIRQAIVQFAEAHTTDIEEFIEGLELSPDDNLKTENNSEFVKCTNSPEYFMENAVNIITKDRGLQQFKLYGFQKQLVFKLENYNKLILNSSRQAGISTLLCSYILHYCLTHPNTNTLLTSYKLAASMELLFKIEQIHGKLPAYIKEKFKCISNTKRYIEFSNGSRIYANTIASPDSIKLSEFDFVVLDEFAHASTTNIQEYMTVIDKMVESNPNLKLIISSTPNGINYFFKLWADAITNFNSYHAIKIPWTLIPGRNNEWKQQEIKNIGYERFLQEYECSFYEGIKGDLYAN